MAEISDIMIEKFAKAVLRAANTQQTKKPKPCTADAEVLRVENGIAYVHITGGAPETPVRMGMACKTGDIVQVRLENGKASLTGNPSAPPTDDTKAEEAAQLAEAAGEAADGAQETADNIKQYFWFKNGKGSEAGAHVTEVPRAEFQKKPQGGNLLLRSNSVKLRMALITLAELVATGLKIYEPGDSTNPVAQFLNTGAVIGKQTDRYTIFTQDGSEYWDGTNNHMIGTRTFYYSNYAGRINDRAVSNTLSDTYAGTYFRTYSRNSDIENESALVSHQGANGVRAANFYARAGHTSEDGEYTALKGQITEPAGFDSFEYHIDPATAQGEFDLGHGKIVAGNFDAGSDTATTAASGTTTTKAVSFNKTFTAAPKVVVGFTYDNSATGTANSFGNCAISAVDITTTGFTAKFYNGSGTQKTPTFDWIALLP